MLDAPRPGHVGDVHQAVHTLLDLDERPEVGQVAHLARDGIADLVFGQNALPGIRQRVLERQRDPPRVPVDVRHDRLDRVARRHDLRGVLDLLRPRHLRDMDEAFDPLLELDEGAVVGDRHDLAADLLASGVGLFRVVPRVFLRLLETQGNSLRLRVVLEDLDLDLVADLEDLGRVVDPAPGHVGDVEEAVQTSQVHEGPVVGQVLDCAAQDTSLLEQLQSLLLLGLLLDLDDRLARQDDVAPFLVHRNDLEVQVAAAQ